MSVIAHTQEHTAQQAQHDSLDSESRLAQFQSGVCQIYLCVKSITLRESFCSPSPLPLHIMKISNWGSVVEVV